MPANSITRNPIHLGLGATATVEPEFTGDAAWYEGYMIRHADDGAEARIVALHSFSEPWAMWEMHPDGAEVVLVTEGSMTLVQEYPDGRIEETALKQGDYAINEPGVWHTADVAGAATTLFITAGRGTQHRPR